VYFIRLAVAATKISLRNHVKFEFEVIAVSRSSKVIDLDANRKRTHNFLLVINSNFGLILYCFQDIDA